MKLIKPSYKILTKINGPDVLKNIEVIGRVCYKSEEKITDMSAEAFIKMLITSGHHSVIEHYSVSVKFICDRGVSHEIVRHRLASFSQESTRYCNYSKDKFDNQLTFIIPVWMQSLNEGVYKNIISTKDNDCRYLEHLERSESAYNHLINMGWQPQQARAVLPNSLKTEIVVTANLREWRTIFEQRCSAKAHPQMRELMCPLLTNLKKQIPIVFDDLYPEII
jgi:thymidylate synthase (FAD)